MEITRTLQRARQATRSSSASGTTAPAGIGKPEAPKLDAPPPDFHAIKIAGGRSTIERTVTQRMADGVRGPGGERGSVSTELLARMAVGAAIGAVSGDEENAIRNGLIGLGVGAALRGPLAAKLAVALKDQTGRHQVAQQAAVSKAQEPYQPNYSHVQAEAEVLHVMKNVHRAVADQITEGMKRPTTHSETTKAAAELITSGEVTPDSVLKGAAVDIETLPAYGKAVRDLAVGSAAEVVRIAKAIAAGEAVPSGMIRQAAALTAELAARPA